MTQPTDKKRVKHVRSSVLVLRALDSEGLTPYTASLVRRWAVQAMPEAELKAFKRRKRRIGQILGKLSRTQRKIVGEFFSHLESVQFRAGIRIGLACVVAEVDRKLPAEEVYGDK